METLETLNKRIATTKNLQSIVRTMRSLSSVSIHQYEQAVKALTEYAHVTELGLQVLLRESPLPDINPPKPDDPLVSIVFGSDHGLCGGFNEQISRFAFTEIGKSSAPAEGGNCLVVGVQAASRLEDMGQRIDTTYFLPGSVEGLTETVNKILLKIDEWRIMHGSVGVMLFYNTRSPGHTASPKYIQLLPLNPVWLNELAERRWPSRKLPTYSMDRQRLFSSLIREHLFVSIFHVGAESIASEHVTRLAAMQAADRNIKQHLEEMTATYRHRRQQDITEELLDITAGFETLRSADLPDDDGE
jgi:F-type H+-transporting ATPase subunit gamma